MLEVSERCQTRDCVLNATAKELSPAPNVVALNMSAQMKQFVAARGTFLLFLQMVVLVTTEGTPQVYAEDRP